MKCHFEFSLEFFSATAFAVSSAVNTITYATTVLYLSRYFLLIQRPLADGIEGILDQLYAFISKESLSFLRFLITFAIIKHIPKQQQTNIRIARLSRIEYVNGVPNASPAMLHCPQYQYLQFFGTVMVSPLGLPSLQPLVSSHHTQPLAAVQVPQSELLYCSQESSCAVGVTAKFTVCCPAAVCFKKSPSGTVPGPIAHTI